MPFNSNNGGGPWGGGGGNRGGGGRNPWGSGPGGGGGGGGGGQGPDLDDLIRKGRDQLRVILGGRGGGPRGPGGGGGGRPRFPFSEKFVLLGIAGVVVLVWLFNSFYRVDTSERSVELFLGKFSQIGTDGLNFAPWPLVTYEILPVTRENTVNVGLGSQAGQRGMRGDRGLMLTGDENIVDIGFQVVWNIRNPADYLFNLAEPESTIRAVSESAMREVIGQRELKPILNRDRAVISAQVQELIQSTMDGYNSGVNIIRVNFEEADPPEQVIDAFREVQAAAQDRDTAEKRAEAFANKTLAEARGEVAQILQDAEGYRARVVNEAKGEAARFTSIYNEYASAPEVTRKRMFLETMEKVLGDVDKVIIDQNVGGGAGGGQGVVPYLPLDQLRRQTSRNPAGQEAN